MDEDFEGKPAKASFKYTVITGPKGPALALIQQAMDGAVQKIVKAFESGDPLYEVLYNRNNILQVRFSICGAGGGKYCDDIELVSLNLKTGKKLRTDDLFAAALNARLAALVNHKGWEWIKITSKETEESVGAEFADCYKDFAFTANELDSFTIGEHGISFTCRGCGRFQGSAMHVWAFPDCMITFDEAGRFLRKDGLLGAYAK